MEPVGENNLQVAPPFYLCQVDVCSPFNAYSPGNKWATLKLWFTEFCCTVTGAVDCRILENYSLGAGAHVHGKVECKIQDIKRSLKKNVNKNRLTVLEWETLRTNIKQY